jgi:alkanesulfonate monooxygenase SsuD/methylene tetrahydromethanopterin reductase-like flavin-dependent oxidoreductase (luciferase family)
MDFGLIFELQTRAPRSQRRDYDLLWEGLREAVRAEEAGFTHIWGVEHHFREHFSHNSAPEVWLAAVAQHTERIRIGHGIVQTLPPFNHPVRVAERLAALDILSNGRLEFGSGRSVNLYEMNGWGIEGNTRDMWLESVKLIAEIWKAGYEPVAFDGEYVSFHDRPVWPRPLQEPHPPMWVAATSPDSYRIAGEVGMGILAFGMAVDAEAMSRRIALYREVLEASEPLGAVKNDNVAIMLMAFCAETRDEARRIAEEPFTWYLEESLRHFLGWAKGGPMPKGYEWYVTAAEKTAKAGGATSRNFDYLLDGGMILCGTPDDIKARIADFERAGATQILMATSVGGIPHEAVLSSIDLIGREVIPDFQTSTSVAAVSQST